MPEQNPILPLNDNDDRFLRLQYKVFEIRIENIFQRLNTEKIDVILIKGWAAAQNYPEPYQRRFVDIDLVVAPEDFERAKALLESTPEAALIDWHRGARHLEERKFDNLLENSWQVKINETWIRVLRPEDHLRILCVHWLNDGGADRERLQDLYWALKNRPNDFSWERLTESVNPVRRKWIIYALGAACRFLKFEPEGWPIADEVKKLPQWFIRAIEREWQSGVRLQPLSHVRHDRQALWEQVLKRLPPNPIQATIEMEGDLDGSLRYWYQLKSIFPRLKPYLSTKK